MVLALPAQAQGQRHALVVGIDRYDNVTNLLKARNDAAAIAARLRGQGFAVTEVLDPDRRTLNQALAQFSARLSVGDEAVFYFAGHGIEVGGRNYLLPADVPVARPGDEAFVTGESIAVDRILSMIQGRGVRVALMILDACRDNPFPQDGTRSVGGQRGLARLEDPPQGAFVLFSAGTQQTALDRLSDNDPNPNSVFTRALLPLIDEPGLSLLELTERVRAEVQDLARSVGHDQFPAYYNQLRGRFVFAAAASEPIRPVAPVQPQPVVSPAPAPERTVDPCTPARADWILVNESRSRAVIEAFIAAHGDCALYLTAAREQLAALDRPAPPAPAPAPAPAPSPAPAPAPTPDTSQAERAAVDFFDRFMRDWSQGDAHALRATQNAYASQVQFYGARRTNQQIVAERRSLAQRWPVRDYRVERNNTQARCRGDRCELRAVVSWQVRNPATGRRASGRWRYDVTLQSRGSGSWVIVAENGRSL